MPTGYTAFIEDGAITNAEDFILLCARSFGACISMRDEPLSKPIPQQFEESSHYHDALERAKQRLSFLESMSDAEIHEANEAEYQKSVSDHESALKKAEALKTKYLEILERVKKWNPPTPEHTALKGFCIEQIQISLPDLSYYKSPVQKESDADWIKNNIQMSQENIEYYERMAREEKERVASRNKWLMDLRSSLLNLQINKNERR